MPKFVCPECEQVIESKIENDVVEEAMDHMDDRHDKNRVTTTYVRENIQAHT